MADDYLEREIENQVRLERAKAGQDRKTLKIFAAIERVIKGGFADLDDDLTGKSRRAIEAFLRKVEAQIKAVYLGEIELILPELEKTAGVFAALESAALAEFVRGDLGLKIVTKAEAFAAAQRVPLPYSGQPLSAFLREFRDSEPAKITALMRQGFYQGQTNQEIRRRLIGTAANRRRDAELAPFKRRASTVVRTTMQHSATQGRLEFFRQNDDVVQAYQWSATLDGRTSTICRSLDRKKWPIGEGPTPPAHPNCRSSLIPVLDEDYDWLSKGAERSAEGGPVSSQLSYYGWLKRQPASVQDSVLGRKRALLFRKGGLTTERFNQLQLDRNFNPMTLDEMRDLAPDAFEKAGL